MVDHLLFQKSKWVKQTSSETYQDLLNFKNKVMSFDGHVYHGGVAVNNRATIHIKSDGNIILDYDW